MGQSQTIQATEGMLTPSHHGHHHDLAKGFVLEDCQVLSFLWGMHFASEEDTFDLLML